jgi:hypothetical protein
MSYAKGKGVAQGHAEAVRWIRKSAEQGNSTAQGYLGECYHLGRGVAPDVREADRWLRKAARQGDSRAKELLEEIEREAFMNFLRRFFQRSR